MTGSRGPLSKPADRRQRRNKPSSPIVLAGGARAPKAPKHLLDVMRERWAVFWASDFAKVVQESQLSSVYRLFDRYDERERAMRTIRSAGRVTEGSQGQLVQHPLLKYIDSCDSQILMLEDRLGLTPRSAAALGIGLVKAKRSLDELNDAMNADRATDVGHETDPRVLSISAGGR